LAGCDHLRWLPEPFGLGSARSSIAELLKQGYEIKGTAYISLQDSQAGNANAAQGQMLVTLQRGQSIAVCEFNWGSWASIASSGIGSFTAADRCDVPAQQ
jgi:hypothetical protein